ncbi:MAG TPA: hypothetical protein DCR55_12295 [Lentisphaeria bacterium]|nr:hypothetical protein [Lentisphaeria bacterium]
MIQRVDKFMDKPMSAMIDVVFLLVIVLVYTHSEPEVEAHAAVVLPSGTFPQTPVGTLLEICEYDGAYQFNGTSADLAEVSRLIHYFGAVDKDITAVIRVSRDAPHREAVARLDLCRDAEIANLRLVALPAGDG